MRRHGIAFGSLALVALVAAGCSSTSDPAAPSPAQVQQGVQSVAPAVTVAAPESGAAGDLVGQLMGQIGSTSAPMQSGVAAAVAAPTCPATFDLGNGITGTCSVSQSGTVTWTFAGTRTIDGAAVQVQGTLVATPSATQPASGTSWTVTLNATASGPRGNATWSATGTVVLDAQNQVIDYSLTMTHTVTPAGGSPIIVNVVLSPGTIDLTVVGSEGHTYRFSFNRTTMTGSVSVNGNVVANVSVLNGCVTIDYVDPSLTDKTICPAS